MTLFLRAVRLATAVTAIPAMLLFVGVALALSNGAWWAETQREFWSALTEIGQIAEWVLIIAAIIVGAVVLQYFFPDAPASLAEVKNGHDFEKWCASQLRGAGWNVQETRGSGDHGVDLVASRSGVRVAVQCKFHAKPVGNGAVLEVVGGSRHYRANATVVVSNSGYTPMAQELATSNGTLLLTPANLTSLGRKL